MKLGELLAIALGYHARGWNVIPITADTKKSKIPGTRWFNQRQTSDDVRRLFENHAGNIAIVCGGVSGNLCVFDAESPELFEAGLDFVTKVSSPRFIHAVRTHRGGHIYFQTKRPIRTIGKGGGRPYEIRASGSYVMAPPSIHPSGTSYQQIHTASHLPMLDEWPGLAGSKGVDFEPLPRPSRQAWDIMSGRASYPSRSEADHALILSLHLSGFTLHEIEAKIMSSRYHSKLRSVSERRRLLEIERSISKLHLPGDRLACERKKICEAMKLLTANIWRGRAGTVDRLVFAAHLEIAERAGRTTYSASSRELADKSTVTRKFVGIANLRLVKAGLLQESFTKPGEATVFTLNCSEITPPNPLMPKALNPLCVGGVISILGVKEMCGAGEPSGIGRAAGQLWEFLRNGPSSAKDLSIATGKSISAVQDALRRLRKVEAIRKGRSRGVWEAVPETNWNEIALKLNVRHKPARRKHIHFQQREAWKEERLNSKTLKYRP